MTKNYQAPGAIGSEAANPEREKNIRKLINQYHNHIRVIDVIQALADVLRSFDTKVINKKATDAANRKFADLWPGECDYSSKLYRCHFNHGEIRVRIVDHYYPLSCDPYTWETLTEEIEIPVVYKADHKTLRFDFDATEEIIAKIIEKHKRLRDEYCDAAVNYDKYMAMNESIKKRIAEHVKAVNPLLLDKKLLGI